MSLLNRVIPPVGAITQAWTGHYKTKGSDSAADCLIGFSFGYRGRRQHITPGLANQDLANIALKHFAGTPKVLQFEIAEAYEASGGKDAKEIIRISKHRQPGRYLDTREVAVQAKLQMEKRGWNTALLLAHPYHMPRVQAVCDKLGINWVSDLYERGAVEFDPLSEQEWTRNLDQWRGYEPLAMMFYRLKGWL